MKKTKKSLRPAVRRWNEGYVANGVAAALPQCMERIVRRALVTLACSRPTI